MDVLTQCDRRILSQCIHMLNHHHIIHFKSSHFIYNYTLIKLEKKNDTNAGKINNRALEPANVPDVERTKWPIS